jgi:Xaa-Pro aminopeptidase
MRFGLNQTDNEQRIDFDRLRKERLAKAQKALANSEADALLLFDMNNVRYTTSTWLGEWARDKFVRYSIVLPEGQPLLFEFGSAVPHKKKYCPWIADTTYPSDSAMRGSIHPDCRIEDNIMNFLIKTLKESGLREKAKIGIDVAEVPVIKGLLENGFDIIDGQRIMLEARVVKTQDEIDLLEYSAATVDSGYSEVVRNVHAGVRENELVAIMNDTIYRLGAEQVEAVNCVSGPRCSPHPHNFSDRLIRPEEMIFMDVVTSFCGYRTCYYRTFYIGNKPSQAVLDAYKKTYDWLYASIELVKPGNTTADICEAFPTAEEMGIESEAHAFALQFGHGIGLSVWEYPVISRRVSMDHPIELKEGMTFALETYAPAKDGTGAARIEEECVVTADGCRVITKYPCDELICIDP